MQIRPCEGLLALEWSIAEAHRKVRFLSRSQQWIQKNGSDSYPQVKQGYNFRKCMTMPHKRDLYNDSGCLQGWLLVYLGHLAHDTITNCYAAAYLTLVSAAPWDRSTLDVVLTGGCCSQMHPVCMSFRWLRACIGKWWETCAACMCLSSKHRANAYQECYDIQVAKLILPGKHNTAIKGHEKVSNAHNTTHIDRIYCSSQLDHHIGHPGHSEVGSWAAQH